MVGLIGRKIGMTQIFDKDGMTVPVSVIEAGPCPVVQIKRAESEGYNAVQIAFEQIGPSKSNMPMIGHFRKANLPPYRYLQEFKVDNPDDYQLGQLLDVSIFEGVEKIDVHGMTKGKGFQGVVKRHGFHGGKKTHGAKEHRVPGSIGMAADPSRVFKGTKLPGQMGDRWIHIRNLDVVEVDRENNLILVKGAVPGARNNILRIVKLSAASG
jgi:large subunit ribosomal protein L3